MEICTVLDAERRPGAPQNICAGIGNRTQCFGGDIEHDAVAEGLLETVFVVFADNAYLSVRVRKAQGCVRTAVAKVTKAVDVVYTIIKIQIFVGADTVVDCLLDCKFVMLSRAHIVCRLSEIVCAVLRCHCDIACIHANTSIVVAFTVPQKRNIHHREIRTFYSKN